ncbi:NADPH-dependent FMN reductase [Microbacterium mitrae]|uniref:NAD(P)H-dependent oxidoreductase n=1 Tax=Microbacterium mitrae TaxID=664640 RepID=A0A5C8HPZ7_9MICO|nr:NADPH-dependent FMN reductase [Microbacterium mitrae]TXK06210.1 NAD(P)H-dependent oxidoreductase [Microbacterium mitrae]
MTIKIGLLVGSLASDSINRQLANALTKLAPAELEIVDIDYSKLALYSHDADANYPAEALDFKASLADVDGILVVTPEYNRSIPGALKNALDWASRPWGQNVVAGKPSAMIGASIGAIGTAVAQSHLRTVLSFLDSDVMAQPEGYLTITPGFFTADGEIADASTSSFLHSWMQAFAKHVSRNAA